MLLLVDNPQDLFDVSTDYFHRTPARCQRNDKGRYLLGDGRRCVIGNILQPQIPQEQWWLLEYRQTCDGLLYAWFGVSPFSNFLHLAMDLQTIHDDYKNWGDKGFQATHLLYDLAQYYKLTTKLPRPPLPTLRKEPYALGLRTD